MAVPANLTTLNMSGKFLMNKSLSDPPEEMLNLQGVGWIKRKAIGSATVKVYMKHSKTDSGVECLSISQEVGGGDPTEPEDKVLDWTEKTKDGKFFGPCVTKSKRVKVEELDEPYLKEGWTADTLEHGCILVYLSSEGKHGWSTKQTWGVGEVDGERRHVRHVCFTGPKGEKLQNRLVYDYLGEP
ncbi:hypothetical protein BT96DRAFT_986025 [Gymnopus androsaceus JB14]|uniref:LCCL domain-containing protein n=1 Tax=Gymnopus androsaceus JB14 TaxID=1447944 RepID=A0A6A4ICG7_9AGAR|nr:hypothetical protein BT96DRAFT_986025 [Gymnopus androsaceus JB14]